MKDLALQDSQNNIVKAKQALVVTLERVTKAEDKKRENCTRLPPMWPGFDFQTRRHMWVEFVGSLLCTERFSPGTPVSPLLKNRHLT